MGTRLLRRSRPSSATLAAERNAVILAHNYQRAEVQEAADFVGDSLELARKAAATDAEVILFCGVHFMAETAKILSPQKTVLMPDPRAGCPMADMVTADAAAGAQGRAPRRRGRRLRQHDAPRSRPRPTSAARAPTPSRSSAASRPTSEIIFVPDQHLGDWVSRQTGREHDPLARLLPDPRAHPARRTSRRGGAEHPDAKVMAHPECPRAVVDLADVVTSTSGMLRYPRDRRRPRPTSSPPRSGC